MCQLPDRVFPQFSPRQIDSFGRAESKHAEESIFMPHVKGLVERSQDHSVLMTKKKTFDFLEQLKLCINGK